MLSTGLDGDSACVCVLTVLNDRRKVAFSLQSTLAAVTASVHAALIPFRFAALTSF